MLKNQIQLITYADSLGNNLKDLKMILDKYLHEVVGGVHILPFYPSSADRGFAPLTHLEVDEVFGDWNDIDEIGKNYDLVVDLVINHISSKSEYFLDYIEKGDKSEWKDIFLDVDNLLSRHQELTDKVFSHTYRPRLSMPIKTVKLKDGSIKRLWCTFSDDQIDLDMTHDKTRELIEKFVINLSNHYAKLIRLDAVGYSIKKPHTNSFLIPETYQMINWIKSLVSRSNVELLAEVHHDYHKQLKLARFGGIDYVYDFSLPMLVLHALHSGTSSNLLNWLKIRPANQITTLDTHDGIGVVDVKGLMPQKEIDETIEAVRFNGGKDALRASGDGANNLDIYQLNTTYYSALAKNDDAYIAARTIQFFVPGIPQVYYVGLLAGENDIRLLNETNIGRNINRHYYSVEEFEGELDKDVVKRLFKLMKFRNTHEAFGGEFEVITTDIEKLHLKWVSQKTYCLAKINLKTHDVTVEYIDESGNKNSFKP